MGPCNRQAAPVRTSACRKSKLRSTRFMRRDQILRREGGIVYCDRGRLCGLRQREADLNQEGESGHQRTFPWRA